MYFHTFCVTVWVAVLLCIISMTPPLGHFAGSFDHFLQLHKLSYREDSNSSLFHFPSLLHVSSMFIIVIGLVRREIHWEQLPACNLHHSIYGIGPQWWMVMLSIDTRLLRRQFWLTHCGQVMWHSQFSEWTFWIRIMVHKRGIMINSNAGESNRER